MKAYLHGLRFPLLIAAVYGTTWLMLGEYFSSWIAQILFDVGRIALVFWSGWLVVTRRLGGLGAAAMAGAIMFLVFHPGVKGTYFLVIGHVQAFQGVLLSYAMFVWVPMAVAVLGALVGRVTARRGDVRKGVA